MAVRNAASVLPEPVGAAMSVWRPAAIDAQPWRCAGVGGPSAVCEPLLDGGMELDGTHGSGRRGSAHFTRTGRAAAARLLSAAGPRCTLT